MEALNNAIEGADAFKKMFDELTKPKRIETMNENREQRRQREREERKTRAILDVFSTRQSGR